MSLITVPKFQMERIFILPYWFPFLIKNGVKMFYQPFLFMNTVKDKFLFHFFTINNNPAGICLLKVNNRSTRTRCEICSKLTIKTPERHQWRRSGVFVVNFEHISHLVLVFLLLTLNM